MLTKQDCYQLVVKSPIDNKKEKLLEISRLPLIEAIRKVNEWRILDLTDFYTKIRKDYNKKKSKLYIDLVREDQKDLDVISKTLSVYLQQAMFWRSENKEIFRRAARLSEVTCMLYRYYEGDGEGLIDILNLIKNDLKAIEFFEKERNERPKN